MPLMSADAFGGTAAGLPGGGSPEAGLLESPEKMMHFSSNRRAPQKNNSKLDGLISGFAAQTLGTGCGELDSEDLVDELEDEYSLAALKAEADADLEALKARTPPRSRIIVEQPKAPEPVETFVPNDPPAVVPAPPAGPPPDDREARRQAILRAQEERARNAPEREVFGSMGNAAAADDDSSDDGSSDGEDDEIEFEDPEAMARARAAAAESETNRSLADEAAAWAEVEQRHAGVH